MRKPVVNALKATVPRSGFQVQTWEDKQGPLLAAIGIEKGILNVLLVPDHRRGRLRHPGHLLHDRRRKDARHRHPQGAGASNGGVMKIFLGYGLLLGLVGAGLGTALGLTFTIYINEIEKLLGRVTGQDIFPTRRSTTSTRSRPTSSR